MSRSYHVTRKSVKDAHKIASCNSNPVFTEEHERLEEQYSTKRRTKRHAKEERKTPDLQQRVDTVDTLPIEIADKSKYLHYPVTEQDVRTLLRLMPQGLTDGLSKITFCLGKQHQSSPEDPLYAEPEKDPYFNRISYSIVNGVFQPRCLGTYICNCSEIQIYGYVYDSGINERFLVEFYLRLRMLCTLIHEIAHHFDRSRRVAKGRWRMDDECKGEIYAESMAYQWIRDYVIPYVEKAYPAELKLVQKWMKEKIGLVLDLLLLMGDCRSTGKKGTIRFSALFNTSSGFEDFVRNIQSEKDLSYCRKELADDLHMAKEYDIAMKILDIVLAKDAKNIDALCLYGDIWCHLNSPKEAIEFAKKALAYDWRNIKAHHVLCNSYKLLKKWHLVLKWASRGIYVSGTILEDMRFKRDYIDALIKQGKIEEAQKTFAAAKQELGKRRLPIFLRRIESELKKKTGKQK